MSPELAFKENGHASEDQMSIGNRHNRGYYGLLDYGVKIIHSVARKAIDLHNGFICKLLVSHVKHKAVFYLSTVRLPERLVQEYSTRAEDIYNGDIFALGNRFKTGQFIEWGKDYRSGFVWQKGRYFRKYIQVDLNNSADVKIPREISRFHFALQLGIAYRLTIKEKYYECFRRLAQNWLQENPFMHSINWACTQDVAIRAVNWIWAISLFQDRLDNDSGLSNLLLHSLYQHGVYIYLHPEKQAFNNHNHYIGDLVGQIYLGLLFSKTKMGREWIVWGTKELFREMRYQVLPSGPSYERSINYHRFVTEMCLSAVVQLSKCGYEIPIDIWYRLELMLEFIMYYTKPDGKAPVVGDQDDARLHPFSLQDNLNHTDLLALGAVLFNRSDFKAAAGMYPIDGLFLLGNDSLDEYDQLPAATLALNSKAYPDAGFYIIRNEKDYMFINNSGKSKNSELGGGTHTHSDLLSFELYVGDKCFLVDPGSYVYSADPEARMLFRSTNMHNTLVVDGLSQNNLDKNKLWDFERNAIPKTLIWSDNDRESIFEGEHTGYQRLEHPVLHRRRIEYDKRTREWKITDCVEGIGRHHIEVFFHFDIGIPIEYCDGVVKTRCKQGMNIKLSFSSSKKLIGTIEEGWVSKAYSHRDMAKIFLLRCEADCPLSIETRIVRSYSETSL